jgi:hypothetical protein
VANLFLPNGVKIPMGRRKSGVFFWGFIIIFSLLSAKIETTDISGGFMRLEHPIKHE